MSRKNESAPKKKSHLGAGLLAGAVFGLAAGIFMSSKEGKKLAKQLQAQTKEVQKRLHTELKKVKNLTEEQYEDAIDNVLAYYTKSKKIAAKEVPELRRYLMGKWKQVKSEMNAKGGKR